MKKLAFIFLLAISSSCFAISLDQAVTMVQEEIGGKVVQTQTVTEDGKKLYRIKIVTPRGDVRIVYVNADSGQIE